MINKKKILLSIVVVLVIIVFIIIGIVFLNEKNKKYTTNSFKSSNYNKVIDCTKFNCNGNESRFPGDFGDGYKYIEIDNYNYYEKYINRIKKYLNKSVKNYSRNFFDNQKLIVFAYDGKIRDICEEDNKINIYFEHYISTTESKNTNLYFIEVSSKDIEVGNPWITLKSEPEDPHMSVDKPILYLYPEKDMNVTVKLKNKDILTTTYPKYNDGWDVYALTNGNLYDKDGNYYYALYWEEEKSKEVSFKEGFYVEDFQAIEFLEEKLSLIGLNERERNEFIMYWLPVLEKNKKSVVYFELTDERQRNNELIINPKPDSLLRVIMHVKKVSSKPKIKEQVFSTFERNGFVAVEWGGVKHN